MLETKKEISPEQREQLIITLKTRFEKYSNRHKDLVLWSLHEMELTGGEPDVVGFDANSNQYTFFDCAPESPKGRRSLCYDREALDSRKEFKPENTAVDLATTMGIELLTEENYRILQKLGNFDTKTSSWLKTPSPIRKLGGAIFAEYRYDNVFVFHNGASSYYAIRGFRAVLNV